MENIPKFARERLKAQVPGTHPEADLLTAFAEQSLKGQERATLLEHLAACADCRAVIALAQPTQPIPAAASKKFSWFSPPVLRWSAALAAILIVGAAIIFRAPHSVLPVASDARVEIKPASPPTPAPQDQISKDGYVVSQIQTRAHEASGTSAPSAKIASLKPPLPEKKMHEKMVVRNEAPLRVPSSTSPRTELESKLIAPAEPALHAGKLDEPSALSAPPIPSASESVEVVSAAPSVSSATAEVSKAKQPAVGGPSGPVGALQKSGASNTRTASSGRNISQLVQFSYPRWTLSAEGSLQRSFDAGKTWENVTVQEGAVFRTVSALGPEVWVGGSAGLLYHSSDAGQHWIRITPATAAGTLTTDIVSIEFTDSRHGKLVTSEGQSWTTSDTGQTWEEQ